MNVPAKISAWLPAVAGVMGGIALYVDLRAAGVALPGGIAPLLAAGAAFAIVLLGLRWAMRRLMLRMIGARFAAPYRARDGWAYLAFLLFGCGAFGFRLSVPVVEVVLLVFALAHTLVALRAMSLEQPASAPFFESSAWLSMLFLVSGMAALIYEIVWQRLLFSIYGVNIESVTMIVAVFMLGLGVGALGGGALSRRYPDRAPLLFAACEIGIAAFGAVSIPLMQAVGARTLHLSLAGVAVVVFVLLLVPVLLMGATLPLLVQHLTRHHPNIGASLGRLYALNTLGAALAAILTVDVLFAFLGRQASVLVAVALNVIVGLLVYRYASRLRGSASPPVFEEEPAAIERLPRWLTLALAFVAGFVSLSQEIVWMRSVSFATQGAAHAFGHVLGAFLIGVAAGAWRAKRVCERGLRDPVSYLGIRLVLAGAVYYLALPLFTHSMLVSKAFGLPLAYFMVGLVAYLMGVVLPLLAHAGVRADESAGGGVALVYTANVVGATAGPLFTGFVLLDVLTLEQSVVLVAAFTIALGMALVLRRPRAVAPRAAVLFGAALVAALLVHGRLYQQVFAKLKFGPDYAKNAPFSYVIQNRAGVIAVQPDPLGDVVYGGGIYDGRFNVGPVNNENGIWRAYMIASLHREPRRMLQIGLSSGSWTWVLAAHDRLERLTVVEINPGYTELVATHESHRLILDHPKIAYHYDDGRRWLRRHPRDKFDLIVMNTTFHWRSNITSLLSREFLELCREHLEPGGVLYYNTTSSPDVARTAAEVFRHVTSYGSFVAASDHPFALSRTERRENLRAFRYQNRSLFDGGDEHAHAVLDTLSATELPELGDDLRARPDLRVITDDNMLPEFKRIYSEDAIGKLYRARDSASRWWQVLRGR